MFSSVTLDTCKQCGGIWFDEGELRQIQQLGPDRLPLLDSQVSAYQLERLNSPGGKQCPICQDLLSSYRYQYSSDIHLNGCDRCGGVWVDEGELKAIAEFMRQDASSVSNAAARRGAALGELAARSYASEQRRDMMNGVLRVLRQRVRSY